MAQPYVGEIRMFAGNFAPAGWEFCSGQLMQISENETLFNLIGTTYGGDGQSTFGLPDLRGRVPIHKNSDFTLATNGGVEEVTLTQNQLPTHRHAALASSNTASSQQPAGNVIAKSTQIDAFVNAQPSISLSGSSITAVGGSQPHSNMQPFLCVDFIISLFGIFPSPT